MESNNNVFYNNKLYYMSIEEFIKIIKRSSSKELDNKIKKFRDKRVNKIISGNTPALLSEGGKLILHLIPLESFKTNKKYNLEELKKEPFKPMFTSGWSSRINFEGLLYYSGGDDETSSSYTQIYRNGIIEAVESALLSREDHNNKTFYIPHATLEGEVLEYLTKCLSFKKKIGVTPPIVCFLTLTGVKGFKMANSSHRIYRDDYPIDRDGLYLPSMMIKDYDTDIIKVVRPIFDLIWNACGISKSFNFDDNNNPIIS